MPYYKVTTRTGLVFYCWADAMWGIQGNRPDVVSVEGVPDSDYVRSAVVFWQGMSNGEVMNAETRERVIARIPAVGLWHAVAEVLGTRCHCARCEGKQPTRVLVSR